MRIRRLWPQRVRTRLTLLYSLLFLAAGSALLGLTYGLVASTLPTKTSLLQPKAVESRQLAELCKSTPNLSGNLLQKCRYAFSVGSWTARRKVRTALEASHPNRRHRIASSD